MSSTSLVAEKSFSTINTVKTGFKSLKDDIGFFALSSSIYFAIAIALNMLMSFSGIMGNDFVKIPIILVLYVVYIILSSYMVALWGRYSFYGDKEYINDEVRRSTTRITFLSIFLLVILLMSAALFVLFFQTGGNMDMSTNINDMTDEELKKFSVFAFSFIGVALLVSLLVNPIIYSLSSACLSDDHSESPNLFVEDLKPFLKANYFKIILLSLAVMLISVLLAITFIGIFVIPAFSTVTMYSGVASMINDFSGKEIENIEEIEV